LILTCLKGINMNGENDKLIRDFMNAASACVRVITD